LSRPLATYLSLHMLHVGVVASLVALHHKTMLQQLLKKTRGPLYGRGCLLIIQFIT